MLDQAQRSDAAPKLVALAREATPGGGGAAGGGDGGGAPSGSRSTTAWSIGCSTASSAPPMVSPGSRPMSKSVRQLAAYAERMHAGGGLGETEELLVEIGIGEYLAQIQGGIPMSQGEIVRPADLGLAADGRRRAAGRAAAGAERVRRMSSAARAWSS